MIQQLKAAVKPVTSAAEGERRVTVLFYSGSPVDRYDWFRDEEWTLEFSLEPNAVRLDKLNDGAPMLKDHWPSVDSTIGRSTKGWIDNGAAYADFRLSDTEDVNLIWQKIQNGTLTDVSMGAYIHQMKDVSKKGGKKHMLATDWEPREVSIVAIGADPGAGFLSAASRSEFEQMLTKRLSKREEMSTEILTETSASGKSDGRYSPEVLAAIRDATSKYFAVRSR